MTKQLNLVTFKRSDDKVDQNIEQNILAIAKHFQDKRTYFPLFCSFITRHTLRFKMNNMKDKLDKWLSSFRKYPGTHKLSDYIEKLFLSCNNKDEINRVRGLIAEALIISKYGGLDLLEEMRNQNRINYGWGAQVFLNNVIIKYECTRKLTPTCSDKSSVDFGIWNGYRAQLYECKVNPNQIGCKEIQYFNKIHYDFHRVSLYPETYFFCLESKDNIKLNINKFVTDDVRLQPLGYEDYYSHQTIS